MQREDPIEIVSRDYWYKVTGMLQQNWALIDECQECTIIYFLGYTGGVFDRMTFDSLEEAVAGLKRNGFGRYSEDKTAQQFIAVPETPFWKDSHPGGPIYSSGQYWR